MNKIEKEKRIINEHKGMKQEYNISIMEMDTTNNDKYYATTINHLIEYDDEKVIITAAIRLERNDPKCEKILNTMVENQESPIVTIFKELEEERREDIECSESNCRYFYSNPLDDNETIEEYLDRMEKEKSTPLQ